MSIGDKIRWAREQMGLTVLELAEKSGVEFMLIEDIENDRDTALAYSELVRIARAVYREPDWFLDGKEPDDPVCLHCPDICSGCPLDETNCKDA